MTNTDSDISTAQADETAKVEPTAEKAVETPVQTPAPENTGEAEKASVPDASASPSPAPVVEATPSENKESALNKDASLFDPNKMGILNDVNIALSIEIGRSEIKIRDLLNLSKGSIIELNKMSGEPVEVYANGKLISLGEIITVNGKYCVKLSACTENLLGAKPNGK